MIRQIVVDFAVLEDSKIIQDDDKVLVMRAVIASEIVQQYQDSRTGNRFLRISLRAHLSI